MCRCSFFIGFTLFKKDRVPELVRGMKSPTFYSPICIPGVKQASVRRLVLHPRHRNLYNTVTDKTG